MAHDLPLACECGAVKGTLRNVSPKPMSRMICYCADCQTYAHHLGRPELLNANGGTDVTPVTPGDLEITEGWEKISALKQTPKGAVRHYASCCNTPIANLAADAKMGWIGLVEAFVDHESHGKARDEVFGPPVHVNGSGAYGDTSGQRIFDDIPMRVMVRVMPRIMKHRFGGGWKKNPFFDGLALKKQATLLSKAERQALKDALPK